jgi:radial spoke head protein 4A
VALKDLYSTPKPSINPETGEPMEAVPPNDFETENVLADAALYEAVGLGLGKSEMYGVMLSLKKLGEDPEKKLATVRFFGKMLGTGGDYYVFESTMSEPGPEVVVPEGETPAEVGGCTAV